MHSPDTQYAVIAAYNEERFIGRALSKLPAGVITPIVAVNGSTDATADIARGFGAETIELEERGKLPAQQAAVDHLRSKGHGPQNPLLFVDADSYPVFPNSWARIMSRRHGSEPEEPQFNSGLTGFNDGNIAANVLRTAWRFQRATNMVLRHPESLSTVFGVNMAVTFGTEEVRQQFLDMPNIWPGVDLATAQLVLKAEGTLHQSIDPRSLVLTSARYSVPFANRLKRGARYTSKHHEEDYAFRRPPTATHRFDLDSNTVVAIDR